MKSMTNDEHFEPPEQTNIERLTSTIAMAADQVSRAIHHLSSEVHAANLLEMIQANALTPDSLEAPAALDLVYSLLKIEQTTEAYEYTEGLVVRCPHGELIDKPCPMCEAVSRRIAGK